MRFIHSFAAFLADAVNLNKTRVDQAHDAFETLTSFLENSEHTKDLFLETFRQGSLRQGTIIKPRKGKTEFDVDLLLKCQRQNGWSARDYLDAVHKAFDDSDRYKELVDRRGKRRCVTIDYAGDFHVDIVPSIDDGYACWIMNGDTNQFEPSDGDGYAAWFEGRSAIVGGGNLAKAVRLAKYMRDEHEWPVKSILLTTILGLQVRNDDTAAAYADLPTTLARLALRVDGFLQTQGALPVIGNPALPAETFTRHWDQETFEKFKTELHRVAGLIKDAYEENDEDASAEKWQEVFGEDFPILDEDLAGGEELAAAAFALGGTAHAQPVAAIPVVGEDLRYRVRVDGWVYDRKGKKRFRGINTDARMASGHALKFRARTDAPEPFDVRWQVVNTGQHAASEANLRGGFFKGHDLEGKPGYKNVTWETTQFTGRHWIECFIVKDGVCVGRSGRFYVNIKNPQF